MDPLFGAIAVVLVALISGLVTWGVSRRTTSGKIDTSEAAKLWDEGTLMRLELRDEVVLLKGQLSDAVRAITDLNREIKQARADTEASREETRRSRAETRILMSQIDSLHDEIKTSNALTIGDLADNTETRRILAVPKAERTATEQRHLDTAGERMIQADRPIIPTVDQGESNA